MSFPTQGYGAALQHGQQLLPTRWMGDLSLKRQLGDDSMLYFTYSRRQFPGGVQSLRCSLSESVEPLAGHPAAAGRTRSTLTTSRSAPRRTYFHRTLSVNLDAFYTIYKDYQIQTYSAVTVCAPPAAQSGVRLARRRPTVWSSTPPGWRLPPPASASMQRTSTRHSRIIRTGRAGRARRHRADRGARVATRRP